MTDDFFAALGIDPDDPVHNAASKMISDKWAAVERLRTIRVKKGLSQEEVAERMGVKVSKVRLLEFQGIGTIYGLITYALAVGATVSFYVEEYE